MEASGGYELARAANRITFLEVIQTRDGIHPSEFRRIAKEQINAYPSVQFEEDSAVTITGSDGNFLIYNTKRNNLRICHKQWAAI